MSETIDDLKEVEKEQLESSASAEIQFSDTDFDKKPSNESMIAGVVLVAVGVIFLFANMTNFHLDNWWALFILIPAFINLGKAFQSYRETGRLDKDARGSLTGGVILALVASVFLFSLDWAVIWPFFLIIGGLAALLGGWFGD